MPIVKLTADFVEAATVEPGKRRTIYWDKSFTNFGLMVSETGHKSYVYQYRDRNTREQSRVTFKFELGLKKAKVAADEARLRVQLGGKPLVEIGAKAAKSGPTISDMLDQFVERYCRKEKNLRTADRLESDFERLVKPDIGDYTVYEIRRSHVVEMLDEIADENGPVAADRTLAYFRKACNWYAARDDEFNSPIVKGMRAGASNARNRILSDEEIRDLWVALGEVGDAPECYPRFIKLLLLTATRRNEAALMHSIEIDGTDWTIPAGRYKTGIDHLIPLTEAARELIGGKPEGCDTNSWFVFTTTHGAKGFSGFSKAKKALDAAIAMIRAGENRDPMPNWRLHDLRRTARTLMTRARVSAEHAERCMGHVVAGVEGVYNRYGYLDEKRAAFEALAAQVAWILKPPQDNGAPAKAAIPAEGGGM